MSPPTRQNPLHLDAGSRYGPTPDDRRDGRPPPAPARPAPEYQWPSTPDPGHRPRGQPSTVPTASSDLAGSSTSALARLPEVLTAPEAAAILRVGRNQLYQAVARGELGAVRIGRSIRIPKHAMVALLASTGPQPASSHEQPRQPAT
jgi:excisionase family DNA binding protein